MGLTVYFMKKYKVIIEGVTPYMQHRMDDTKLDQWEKLRPPIHERPEVSHEDAVRAAGMGVNDVGFGHILPVSLALVSKISPRRMLATSVGIYYLAFFLANYVVGIVGGWYSTMATPQFWLVHVGAAVVGLVCFVLFKLFLSHRFSDEGREAPD